MVAVLLIVLVGLLVQTVQPAPTRNGCRNRNLEYGISNPLIVYGTPDSPPLNSKNSLDIANGADVELMNEIAVHLCIEIHYEFRQFSELLSAVAANPNSIAFDAITITDERRQTVLLVSYLKTASTFLVRSTSTQDITDLNSLCGKTVVVETASKQVADVENQDEQCRSEGRQGIKILFAPSYSDLVKAVQNGSADVGIDDILLLQYTVDHSGGVLKITGNSYNPGEYGIAVNPKKLKLAKDIAKALVYLLEERISPHTVREYKIDASKYIVCNPTVNRANSTKSVKPHLNDQQCDKATAET